MKTGSSVFKVCLFVFPLLIALGCSDDDNPTAPPPGSNPPGGSPGSIEDLVGNLQFIQTNYLDPNNEAGNSLGLFLPQAAGLLGPTQAFPTSGGTTNCIPDSLLGSTYEHNGTMYVLSPLSGAPAEGVRFLLYPVDDMDVPDFSVSNGHMDFTCLDDGAIAIGTFKTNIAGLDVIEITRTRASVNPTGVTLTGLITALGQSEPFLFQGTESAPGAAVTSLRMTYTLASFPGFQAMAAKHIMPAQNEIEESSEASLITGITAPGTGLASPDTESQFFRLVVSNIGDLSETVQSGFVLYLDGTGIEKHIGCVSGNLDEPTFQNVTDGMCTLQGATVRDATPEELNDTADGHEILRELTDFFFQLKAIADGAEGGS